MLNIEIPEENKRKDAIIDYQAYTIGKLMKALSALRQEVKELKAKEDEREQK